MRFTHFDYINEVQKEYKRKCLDRNFSRLLVNPTPASIKKACIHICKERYNKKDETILRDFFGPIEERNSVQIIENFETTKFKAFANYLKGYSNNTDIRNINLLAWLIDYQPRPYVYDLERPQVEDGDLDPGKHNNPGIDVAENVTVESGSTMRAISSIKEKRISPLIALLITAGVVTGGYFFWRKEKPNEVASNFASTSCMYWADTQYVIMPCNEERIDRLKLPLDQERLNNFRRITREDTITERSVGRIYYIKNNGVLELYTTGGHHPIEVNRKLNKLTEYMFNKYLSKQKQGLNK